MAAESFTGLGQDAVRAVVVSGGVMICSGASAAKNAPWNRVGLIPGVAFLAGDSGSPSAGRCRYSLKCQNALSLSVLKISKLTSQLVGEYRYGFLSMSLRKQGSYFPTGTKKGQQL
jgi:hypothetical protein